jgi:enoyl-CoA hydratase
MTDALLVRRDDAVTVLTLNRPDHMNALDTSLRGALVAALEAANGDPGVRAVLITGSGDRAFCAGQDLNESASLADAAQGDWIGSWDRFFAAFRDFGKPLVVAQNGVAAGGGFELAMLADLRLAVPGSRLIMAEIDVALPTVLGSHYLAAHAFESRMREIVLTARPVSAEEAHDIGLVHELVPADRLLGRALERARELAAKPPVAMALNVRRFRELRRRAMERDGVPEALRRYQSEAVASGEPARVMAAFLEERARRRRARTG